MMKEFPQKGWPRAALTDSSKIDTDGTVQVTGVQLVEVVPNPSKTSPLCRT